MKAPDRDELVKAIGVKLDGHDGQLRTHHVEPGPKRNQIDRHGLVDAMQMVNQDTRSVYMERPPQRAWWAVRAMCSLLRHLRPSSDMADGVIIFDSVHPPRMAQ